MNGRPAPEFVLNNRSVSLCGVGVHTTLLDYVRAQGLTGAKEGCAEGECGACTVVLVAPSETGSAYRAVNSCLMLAPMAAGHEVLTVEGLSAGGELAPVQRAMAEAGGSQCGYCTPGFVMSLFAEQYRPGRTLPCDPHALGGNLCRCTGYRPIHDAAVSLGLPPSGPLLARLSTPAPILESCSYEMSGIRFSRPAGLAECLSLLAGDPQARVIAGGTDLVVAANLQGRRWNHLISLEAIPELRAFRETRESISIGSALPLNDLVARWTSAPGVMDEWLRLFASPTLRNRATLGGSLATASPIGDSAPLLLALNAGVRLAGARGSRAVALADFFTGYRRTVLAPDEIIVSIEIPKPLPGRIRFYKVAKRRMDDISSVSAAIALDLDEAGLVTRARFAFGGVAPVPLLIPAAEGAVLGQPWDAAAVQRVQTLLDVTLEPVSDHRASSAYRLAVAKSLVAKYLWETQEGAV